MRYTLFLIALITIISCKSKKTLEEMTANDVRIEFKRGACFGKCPIYDLKIYNGGLVELNAKRFGKRQGRFSKQLSKKTYNGLVKAFEESNFSSFDEHYESNIADLPMITISYNESGSLKSVMGKDTRPQKIMDLQFKLESIYNEEGWKLLEEYKPMTEAPKKVKKEREIVDKSKIIIKPKPGTRLPTFFKEMKEYSVQLVTRISEDQNLWLITYDKSKMSPDKMLELIKNHKSIEMAQFDKKVSSRGSEGSKM